VTSPRALHNSAHIRPRSPHSLPKPCPCNLSPSPISHFPQLTRNLFPCSFPPTPLATYHHHATSSQICHLPHHDTTTPDCALAYHQYTQIRASTPEFRSHSLTNPHHDSCPYPPRLYTISCIFLQSIYNRIGK
jgi:hypothetical protein